MTIKETNSSLVDEMNSINWHRSININGVGVTPGNAGNITNLADSLGIFPNMENKTVLDIGAWDGGYSFLAEEKGAKRVLATDSYIWDEKNSDYSKKGFIFAHKHRNSNVDSQNIDIMDISFNKIGIFDITLFLGVLYHLQDPLRALRNLREVTKELILIETIICNPLIDRSFARYYERDTLNNDETNCFVPTINCLKGWLEDTGFEMLEIKLGQKKSVIKSSIQRLIPFELAGTPFCRVFMTAKPK
tara:strand:+ start:3569 stop:4309 length:741 start_codon:yes stop_codon:yes gene_type:complete